MMAGMRGRVLAWAGGAVAVAAAVGLGVYFAVAGLDKADKLASVASMFIGLAGLVASVYGMLQARRDAPGSSSAAVEGGQSDRRLDGRGGCHAGEGRYGQRPYRRCTLAFCCCTGSTGSSCLLLPRQGLHLLVCLSRYLRRLGGGAGSRSLIRRSVAASPRWMALAVTWTSTGDRAGQAARRGR